MTQPAGRFGVRIDRIDDYEFRIRFDNPDFADLLVDEPPPLGKNHGPNPARLFAAAVGSCLSASLLFCLRRAKVPVASLSSDVDVELVRNERKRLRIGRVTVQLSPELPAGTEIGTCLDAFEDFCVVTQSVRDGIDIAVAVKPRHPDRDASAQAPATQTEDAP